jgi:hypothetical protein
MSDLLDVLPNTAVESVKVGSQFVIVRGLNARELGMIVSRFPNLASMLRGIDLSSKLVEQLGGAIGPVIAAGVGKLGDEKYEQHAERFLIEDQFRLAMAIIRLTFPKGFGPFVKMVWTEMAGDEGAKPIKMRVRAGRSISQDSSAEASPSITQ